MVLWSRTYTASRPYRTRNRRQYREWTSSQWSRYSPRLLRSRAAATPSNALRVSPSMNHHHAPSARRRPHARPCTSLFRIDIYCQRMPGSRDPPKSPGGRVISIPQRTLHSLDTQLLQSPRLDPKNTLASAVADPEPRRVHSLRTLQAAEGLSFAANVPADTSRTTLSGASPEAPGTAGCATGRSRQLGELAGHRSSTSASFPVLRTFPIA